MGSNRSIKITCKFCGSAFQVGLARKDTAKFCSRSCSDSSPRQRNTVRCRECGVEFPQKASQAKKANLHGSFCGQKCLGAFRSRVYSGDGNPNSKGRNINHDGYRIYTPAASLGFGLGKMKLHHAVAFTALGITKLPKGMHVHHRDCDVKNNAPENLQIITSSDHKWLHQQFGVAALRAIISGKISAFDAHVWSDDPCRALPLLLGNVLNLSEMAKYLKSKYGIADLGVVSSLRAARVEFEQVEKFSYE